jgi:uncharacterized RDD family membrane protein YckC
MIDVIAMFAAGKAIQYFLPLIISLRVNWIVSVWGAEFVIWMAMHGYFLVKGSQTIGKRLLAIQIVDFASGKPASFVKIVFVRKLSMQLVLFVPTVGAIAWLIGLAFIFGKDRRCIHDVIAGTKVVDLRAKRSLRL